MGPDTIPGVDASEPVHVPLHLLDGTTGDLESDIKFWDRLFSRAKETGFGVKGHTPADEFPFNTAKLVTERVEELGDQCSTYYAAFGVAYTPDACQSLPSHLATAKMIQANQCPPLQKLMEEGSMKE